MAVRNGAYIKTQVDPFATLIEWTALSAGDTAQWMMLGHYNDKCVQVYGTFSAGATITFEGSNEDVPANGAPLTDPTQTVISFTQVAIRQVLENPLFIRPVLAGGDGSTSLTVRVVCRQ